MSPGLQAFGIALHTVRNVAVIPAVEDDLDEDGVGAAVLVHVLHQHLQRALVPRPFVVLDVGMGEGVALRIIRPHVHVGVDNRRIHLGAA